MKINKILIILFFIFQETIELNQIDIPLNPKISWSNIDFEAPLIKIYFSSNFKIKNTLKNFWLHISIPFYVLKLNAEWDYFSDCKIENNYSKTIEERILSDNDYSYFYIQLSESIYYPEKIYILKLQPDRYMSYLGFSPNLKISIISSNTEGFLTYSYNNSFFHFYGHPKPIENLIAETIKFGNNCLEIEKICLYEIRIKIEDKSTNRIFIILNDDYVLADDIDLKCAIIGTEEEGYIPLSKKEVDCHLGEYLQEEKRSLIFLKKLENFEPGNYLLRLSLKTPKYGGSNSLKIFIMDSFGSEIKNSSFLKNIFETKPLKWVENYPKLYFSFGFNANDPDLPLGIGLFSMSTTYNQVFNTLLFIFKVNNLPLNNENDEGNFKLELYFGTSEIILVKGSIVDNLDKKWGKEKEYKVYDNKLQINNLNLSSGKKYKINLKIGFKSALYLDDSESKGFGVIKYIYNEKVIVTGTTKYKNGFTKIIENKNIFLPESVDKTKDGYHRGYSAFRSEKSTILNNIANNYFLAADNNGLRNGEGQEFYFQSSLGPNSLYFSNGFSDNHDSSKTVIEVITHKSIKSRNNNFDEKNIDKNCKIYLSKLDSWNNSITKSMAQTIFDPTNSQIITTEPPDYNPIGGCSYKLIKEKKFSFSRFRWKLKDFDIKDQNGDNARIIGAKMVFADNNTITDPSPTKGNLFVFKNIHVSEQPSNIYIDEKESSVFDVFIRVYFYSNLDDINDLITKTPNIIMMDNLYVVSRNNPPLSFPNIRISLHNMFYKRSLDLYQFEHLDKFPYIFHLHGAFDNLPLETFSIQIYLDFLYPITINNVSQNVDCSGKGIWLKKCYFKEGLNDFVNFVYREPNLQQTKINTYNSRLSNSIVIELNQHKISEINDFSIVFPFNLKMTPNLLAFLKSNSYQIKTYPIFVLFDNTQKQIARVDFCETNIHFEIKTYDTNYEKVSMPILTQTQTKTLDDATLGNETIKSVFITPKDHKLGSIENLKLNIFCNDCGSYLLDPQIFSSSTFCTDYNFYSDLDFWVDIDNLDTKTQFHAFMYNLQNLNKYCLYIPDIKPEFDINNFKIPSSNAGKWPETTFSVLSEKVFKMGTYQKYLNEFFIPNKIKIISEDLTISKNMDSSLFDFKFLTTNTLKKHNFIHLKKITGSFLFQLKGDITEPLCKIYQNEKIIKCIYSIEVENIKIEIFEDILENVEMNVNLFGLSVKDDYSAVSLDLQILTDLDGTLNIETILDDSSPEVLKITYLLSNGSGNINLSNIETLPNLANVKSTLKFKITLLERNILEVDQILLDFGQAVLTENPYCLIYEPFTNLILESISFCQILNERVIKIGFFSNVGEREFEIILNNFYNPPESLPGITGQYTFNKGYIAFESSILYYPDFEKIEKVNDESKTRTEIQLNASGFTNNLKIFLTPNITIQKSDIIFIKFESENTPNLSPNNIRAYENNFVFWELRTWIEEPLTLAVTGFKIPMDGQRQFSFWIENLKNSNYGKKIDIYITSQKGLSDIKEVFEVFLKETKKSDTVMSLYLKNSYLSNRYLRSFGKLLLELHFQTYLSFSQYILINLEFLDKEVFKPFVLTVNLYNIEDNEDLNYFIKNRKSFEGKEINLEENHLRGTIVYIKLGENTSKKIIVELNNLPTPDYKTCFLKTPIIIVSNSSLSKVMMTNPIFSSNFDPTQLESKENIKLLNFLTEDKNLIKLQRGFYKEINIYIDEKDEQNTYLSKSLSYLLSYNLDGLFDLSIVKGLSINSLTSKVGEKNQKIGMGSNPTSVLSVYNLVVAKQEPGISFYSELPLLSVEVFEKKEIFEIEFPLILYKGGSSLPLIFDFEKIPFDVYNFKIQILDDPKNYITFFDGLDKFFISINHPIHFIKLVVNSNINVNTARLIISPEPDTETFNIFSTSIIKLEIRDLNPNKVINFIVSPREIGSYDVRIDFTADSEIYLLFAFFPSYEKTVYTKNYLENIGLKGIKNINKTYFRLGVIYNYRVPLTFVFDDIESGTDYIIQGFYQSPENNIFIPFEEKFKTKKDKDINGKIILNFDSIVFMSNKQQILCKFAEKFSIPFENIWSHDGINCENNLMKIYQKEFILEKERWFNKTLSEESEKLNSNDKGFDSKDDEDNIINKLIKQIPGSKILDIRIYQSKKKNHNIEIYNNIFKESRKKTFIEDTHKLINTSNIIINFNALVQIFYRDPPIFLNLINQNNLKISSKNILISGIQTEGKGNFLGVLSLEGKFKNLKKKDFFNISNFLKFHYTFLNKNTIFEFLFQDLKTNTTYTLFYSTSNEDNRDRKKDSEIYNITFTTLIEDDIENIFFINIYFFCQFFIYFG